MEAPAIFTEAEFYQRNFDPHEYLKEFYSMSTSREGASAFMMQNLRNLHKTFSSGEHSRSEAWAGTISRAAQRGASFVKNTPLPARVSVQTGNCSWSCATVSGNTIKPS